MAIPVLEGGAVRFELDGAEVFAQPGESILEAARRYGAEIPHLCYKPGYRAAGNCRACVVEIDGERALAPSCCRAPGEGMKVFAANERARHSQKMVTELLLADLPQNGGGYQPRRRDDEFEKWRKFLNINTSRFAAREQPQGDVSHPAMEVNLESCIQCARCVRACREEQVNGVIGYAGRGAKAAIVFDFAQMMGESTCVGCGECVQACPTGALAPARGAAMQEPEESVQSLCPYCGVGCQTTYHIKDNKILYAEGRDGPANRSRLCVKGRFGGDYARHRHRLLKPLIRLPHAKKDPQQMLDPDNWREVFREAEWDEALDTAGGALRKIRDKHGGGALAGFGSAKGSNEEAYLFQKLVRTGFGGNNVDHCTRLCHASSVAALLEGIGSGAVSNQVSDVLKTEVAVIIGANPAVNHPVAATVMKNAAARGVKLITVDPRGSSLSEHAALDMRIKPDSDVAFLNAMMHVIVEEGMADDDFVNKRTKESQALKEQVSQCSPEAMSPVCGVSADDIRAAARMYGGAKRAMIFWGMGVSQHTHGTDNARCLIALAMLTGNIGKDGCGLHPLRGQNNVQGASDAGLIPMVFPDYKRVDDDNARARFEKLWGCELSGEPGLTVVEIVNAALRGEIRGMYVMGENPAMSDPDANHARAGLANLEMLAVQDIFLTETAALADVVFPASAFAEKTGTFTNTDRMVQLGRKALQMPGDARQDLWIIQQMARRMGLDWHYEGEESGVARVFDEMRRAMPSIGGITWDRLQNEHSVVYPCAREGDAGEPVIFKENFPTTDGLGRFVPADFAPAKELPDDEYPFVLITGRELEHWHTGAMTRRSEVLDALEPSPTVSMNPDDMLAANINAGDMLTVSSRRGAVSLLARADKHIPPGAVFIPFCYYEAAANLLTNPALDPYGKIPEFKYCAVKVEPGGKQPPPLSFGGGAAKNGGRAQTGKVYNSKMAEKPATAQAKGPIVVSIINLKGGVGKTTVATILARHAADIGLNVLAVDLDPQANLSQALMRSADYKQFMDNKEPSIVELFSGYLPPSAERAAPSELKRVAKTVRGWKYRPESPYHLIPSRFNFSHYLVDSVKVDERVLAKFIAKEMGHKDLILIDCAPTESVLTRTAYHASAHILIPARTEHFSTIGFPLLQKSLEKFKSDNDNQEIGVCGVLINRAKTKGVPLRAHYRDSLREIKERAQEYGWPVMKTQMVHSDGYPKLMKDEYPNWSGDSKDNARDIAEEFMAMMGLSGRR